jgi:hypothetical protein
MQLVAAAAHIGLAGSMTVNVNIKIHFHKRGCFPGGKLQLQRGKNKPAAMRLFHSHSISYSSRNATQIHDPYML